MILGATSGAGKSLIAAALCRILSDMGLSVAPFKAQNMSLNSVVTASGEEISRSQDLQARAARVEPKALMNPLLLKPKRGARSQVIVLGRPFKDMSVEEYGCFAASHGMRLVREAFQKLEREHDVIVLEGAGSPAEINFDDDISNMRTAEASHSSCLLVVNMEWGGAFAYAYGTLMLQKPEWRRMFKGIIFNNLRGDTSSLESGIKILERETGIPVIGIVPHVDHILPDEDAMHLPSPQGEGARVGVIKLPHLSNFTDFDALTLESASIVYVDTPTLLDSVDAIIVPGTKNTISDLEWMRKNGIAQRIIEMADIKPILGICGGYQMLGREIVDLKGLEGGSPGKVNGLQLLDVITNFDSYDKRTVQVQGFLAAGDGGPVRGYEIHMGSTSGGSMPLFIIDDAKGTREEGCVSGSGMIMGTYLHGAFDLPPFRHHFLGLTRKNDLRSYRRTDLVTVSEESIKLLAETVRRNVDIQAIMEMIEVRE